MVSKTYINGWNTIHEMAKSAVVNAQMTRTWEIMRYLIGAKLIKHCHTETLIIEFLLDYSLKNSNAFNYICDIKICYNYMYMWHPKKHEACFIDIWLLGVIITNKPHFFVVNVSINQYTITWCDDIIWWKSFRQKFLCQLGISVSQNNITSFKKVPWMHVCSNVIFTS